MKYYSTKDKSKRVSFRQAVIEGLSNDGGLYMPVNIEKLNDQFWTNLEKHSFQEIGFKMAQQFVGNEISEEILKNIIDEAIDFPAPLIEVQRNEYILELFHGPTLAFKDFGARFMARVMSYFNKEQDKELNILVATSGDTGSAVASGFYGIEGINVFILYPAGGVSEIQEKQLTTLDKNITALEIDGTFDDCQKLVKQAFVDKELTQNKRLSSANSINIARLIPQSFYYAEAYKQLKDKSKPVIFSIPSGNLGNLTGGLFAKKMGLPVNKFIAATNSNSVFTDYIFSGKYQPRTSVKTLSNAMDVGTPSNIERVDEMHKYIVSELKENIYSASFDDEITEHFIKRVYRSNGYIIDPHGAVGYLALQKYLIDNNIKEYNGIVLETAHPAKFKDTVEKNIDREIDLPLSLKEAFNKKKKTIKLSSDYQGIKEFFLNI